MCHEVISVLVVLTEPESCLGSGSENKGYSCQGLAGSANLVFYYYDLLDYISGQLLQKYDFPKLKEFYLHCFVNFKLAMLLLTAERRPAYGKMCMFLVFNFNLFFHFQNQMATAHHLSCCRVFLSVFCWVFFWIYPRVFYQFCLWPCGEF